MEQPNFNTLRTSLDQATTEIVRFQNIPATPDANALITALDALRNEIAGLRGELKTEFTSVRDSIAGVRCDVARLQAEVSGVPDSIAGLCGDVARLQTEVTGVRGDVARLRAETGVRSDADNTASRADRWNAGARAQNQNATLKTSPLQPFVGLDGLAIEGFPLTVRALDLLTGNDCRRILEATGVDALGTEPEVLVRLKVHIGVIC